MTKPDQPDAVEPIPALGWLVVMPMILASIVTVVGCFAYGFFHLMMWALGR